MAKISVIIPVYNVEKTLCQCLDSVINQTYKDLEIICVNDCSTDNSAEILEEYKSKDLRIVVLNNDVNIGLGLTRNHGMQKATGEYVHFLDSDDWMELDAYETLVENLENNPDVVCFLWNNIDVSNGKIRVEKFKKDFSPTNFEKNPEIIEDWGVSVWHRLYKREYLNFNKICFNDYKCMEDVEYIYKVLATANVVNFINKPLINYRINNPQSLIGKAYKYYDCAINSYDTIYEFSKILPDEKREIILAKSFNSLLYRLVGSFSFGIISYKELREIITGIDLSVFYSKPKTYKWFVYYNEIMNYPPFVIKFLYRLRLFIKNDFYSFYQKLSWLKERIS